MTGAASLGFRVLRRLLKSTLPAQRPESRLETTLREWLIYHQSAISFEACTWRGVRAMKNPLDCWIYQEILWEVQPDVVVEIGSAEGGSTLFLADMLELIGKGKVISIDADRTAFQVTHSRIETITGPSSDPGIVKSVGDSCGNGSVLVVHDADHSCDQVRTDLESYCGLVTPGSYLIVEDGIIDLFAEGDGIGTGQPGPLAAIRDFLKSHPEFSVDEKRERYLITYNPQGYLKKVG